MAEQSVVAGRYLGHRNSEESHYSQVRVSEQLWEGGFFREAGVLSGAPAGESPLGGPALAAVIGISGVSFQTFTFLPSFLDEILISPLLQCSSSEIIASTSEG